MDNALVNSQGGKQKYELLVGSPPLFVSLVGNYTGPETGNYKKINTIHKDSGIECCPEKRACLKLLFFFHSVVMKYIVNHPRIFPQFITNLILLYP